MKQLLHFWNGPLNDLQATWTLFLSPKSKVPHIYLKIFLLSIFQFLLCVPFYLKGFMYISLCIYLKKLFSDELQVLTDLFSAANTWLFGFRPAVAEPCLTASIACSVWWILPWGLQMVTSLSDLVLSVVLAALSCKAAHQGASFIVWSIWSYYSFVFFLSMGLKK